MQYKKVHVVTLDLRLRCLNIVFKLSSLTTFQRFTFTLSRSSVKVMSCVYLLIKEHICF